MWDFAVAKLAELVGANYLIILIIELPQNIYESFDRFATYATDINRCEDSLCGDQKGQKIIERLI